MMYATCWKDDDILEVCLSDKPIAREFSESWHVHKSYAADGDLAAVVILDAVKEGYFTAPARIEICSVRGEGAERNRL